MTVVSPSAARPAMTSETEARRSVAMTGAPFSFAERVEGRHTGARDSLSYDVENLLIRHSLHFCAGCNVGSTLAAATIESMTTGTAGSKNFLPRAQSRLSHGRRFLRQKQSDRKKQQDQDKDQRARANNKLLSALLARRKSLVWFETGRTRATVCRNRDRSVNICCKHAQATGTNALLPPKKLRDAEPTSVSQRSQRSRCERC